MLRKINYVLTLWKPKMKSGNKVGLNSLSMCFCSANKI